MLFVTSIYRHILFWLSSTLTFCSIVRFWFMKSSIQWRQSVISFHSIFWVPPKIDAIMCITLLHLTHVSTYLLHIPYTRVNRLKAHALSHSINVQFFSDFGSPMGIHVFRFDSEFSSLMVLSLPRRSCWQFNGPKMNGGWKTLSLSIRVTRYD